MAADDNEAELRLRDLMGDRPSRATAHQEPREGPDTEREVEGAKDGAREPAPGEADPLSDPKARPLDRRERSL